MKINTDVKKIEEILTRSIDTVYPTPKEFKEMLSSGKQLRIYMGIDPTATYVHLGHATNYIILRRLHDLGHKIIVLIGDFTAMIGDPSDKNAMRKRLTKEDVLANLKTFKEQIGKILDFDNKENPIELRFNSEWLSKLTFEDGINLASHFTVQRMLERDNFEKRIKENKPLYVHEFFYPLMQGYDSVALEADVEIGGTDQTFNMLAGRALVKAYQNREKIVMTTTLLENPVTGEKLMSKSLGTGIGLDEKPNDMFGKTMALPDEAIIQVFVDCTYLSMEEIKKMEKELKAGANPRDLKVKLAGEIVKMYHGEKAATVAQEYFVKTFCQKEIPDEIPEIKMADKNILAVLVAAGFVKSKAEARRVVQQGGVKVNDQKAESIELELKSGDVIQKGSRFFVKIK
ncbi:MAG: tyrosine--tRNA ligase [Candidatus Magasanikbacteria bacterium]|nr:tyrosine--tRNA ligase [Candidatus Magasanikbacteria bacterium]